MTSRLSPRAELDLDDIGGRIAVDNPLAAVRFIRSIRVLCKSLEQFPKRHPFDQALGLHKAVFGHYLIFYRVRPSELEIVRILHGARDYESILMPDPES